jgi:hypothetical protein
MSFKPEQLAEIGRAKRAVVEGKTVLWNLRLEALVEQGALRDALDFAVSAVEDTINNCGCNVQCGARGEVLSRAGG